MLDHHLAPPRGLFRAICGHQLCRPRPIQPRIDVPCPRDLEFREALRQCHLRYDLVGNLSRSFTQSPRQLKRDRQRKLTKLDLRWLFHHNVCQLNVVFLLQEGAHMCNKTVLQ